MSVSWHSIAARVHEQLSGESFELDRAVALLREWAGVDNSLVGSAEDAVQRLIQGRELSTSDLDAIRFIGEEVLALFALPNSKLGMVDSNRQFPPDAVATGAFAGLLLAAIHRMTSFECPDLWFRYASDCAYYWREQVDPELLLEYFWFVISALREPSQPQ